MKSKMDENFEKIFNLPESVNDSSKQEIVVPVDQQQETIDNDFRYARENLYGIIEKGSDALDELVELAKQSQSPRAFEIVSQMVKTLTDSNKDLLELQRKNKLLKQEEQKGPNNVTNALFVGNTAELQKLLKDSKK